MHKTGRFTVSGETLNLPILFGQKSTRRGKDSLIKIYSFILIINLGVSFRKICLLNHVQEMHLISSGEANKLFSLSISTRVMPALK